MQFPDNGVNRVILLWEHALNTLPRNQSNIIEGHNAEMEPGLDIGTRRSSEVYFCSVSELPLLIPDSDLQPFFFCGGHFRTKIDVFQCIC